MICKFLRQLLKSRQMFSRSKWREGTRVLQGTSPCTLVAKATVLTALERISGMTQAQPYPSTPSWRKRGERETHRFRGGKSARHLKGGSVNSPPHPLFKGVFLTLVAGQQLEETIPRHNDLFACPSVRCPPPLGRAGSLKGYHSSLGEH